MASKYQEIMGVKRAVWVLAAIVLVGLLSLSFFYQKETPMQSYIIGIVSPGQGMSDSVKGFIEGMTNHGFKDGKNVSYVTHESKMGVEDALNAMMKKNVDLIFTLSTPLTQKAKNKIAGSKVPVVFIMHDPVAAGVIDSLVKPGGNLTGIQVRGDAPKALEWLQIIMPDIKRVFAPVSYGNIASINSLQDLQEAGEKLQISIVSERVETKEELENVLNNMPDNIDAIVAIHSVVVISNIETASKIAMEKKVPILSLHHSKEATMTFGVDGYKAGIKASRLANQILQGVKPADIPTELADFRLSINLQKAQHIGLQISDEILLQTDRVIH